MKAKLAPLLFSEANERERDEFDRQLAILREMYGDAADFLEPTIVGEQLPPADAIVFPQLIGAAFRHRSELKSYDMPMVVLTSRFGTVEMWDWEIVTFLRSEGMNVFSPYSVDLARTVIRALAARQQLKAGAKFLMFQDSPGEGMQAYIFKRFYWWEEECTTRMQEIFGINMIYRSWKEVNRRAREIDDESARRLYQSWEVRQEGLADRSILSSVKIYMAVKEVIEEIGGVEGVGANCLNESFNSDTTPCLAWNMIFEKDDIIWACEGDTLTLLSTFILYRSLREPIMMTNIYPFLMGMAAISHEKIDKFPEIDDSDNHALGVHCGYFGLVPRQFCSSWTMCPKVLEIVDDNAIALDCEMPMGRITLAKIHPDFNKLLIIQAEIVDYVRYPDSDCRKGALIRYKDGERVMEELCSHHALILTGDQKAKLLQVARIFGWEAVVI